jgi:putative endonuclease
MRDKKYCSNRSENNAIASSGPWHVYMLRTRAGHLYTGISTDPQRRLLQHEACKTGARSLRGKGPFLLVWQQAADNRSDASKLEAGIKKLSKPAKEKLVSEGTAFVLSPISERDPPGAEPMSAL